MKKLLLFAAFVILAFGKKTELSSALCASSDCSTWSDSCNVCSCLDGVGICTNKACSFYSTPHCVNSHKEENSDSHKQENILRHHSIRSRITKGGVSSNPSQTSNDMPQNSNGMPQNSNDMPQNSNGMPQNSNDMPQNSNGMPQNSNDMPQNSNDMPQNSNDMPQNSNGVTQNSNDMPQNSNGMPQTSNDSQNGNKHKITTTPWIVPTTTIEAINLPSEKETDTVSHHGRIVIIILSIFTVILAIITRRMCKHAFCRIKCGGCRRSGRRCNSNMQSV